MIQKNDTFERTLHTSENNFQGKSPKINNARFWQDETIYSFCSLSGYL